MKIVDSHQHPFWHDRDHHGLVADMDAHGIAYAWLLSWEVRQDEWEPSYDRVLNPLNSAEDGTHLGIPLRDLLTVRDAYPERFVVGYCPHPLKRQAPALLEAAYHIHGVRVCGEWKFRVLFDDPRCLNLYRKAGELKMPVVLHLDVPYLVDAAGVQQYAASWYGGTVANLERALAACPETTFVGHAPGFWREISGNADDDGSTYPTGPVTPGGRLYELFDRYPNLVADLSAGSGRRALERDREHAQAFIQRFADRLLFGRDYYEQDLHRFLQSLDLAEEVKAQIYHRNAERLVSAPGAGA